jgi:exopolysaccharide biosynthesis WecB/TagA/CpsF family protein
VAGLESPAFGFDHRPDEYDAVCERARAATPDMVFVGLGFPKQERVIARLSAMMPSTWFMGCGAAIGFVAGTHRRDLPFAVRLLSSSTWIRLRRAPGRPDEPRMESA